MNEQGMTGLAAGMAGCGMGFGAGSGRLALPQMTIVGSQLRQLTQLTLRRGTRMEITKTEAPRIPSQPPLERGGAGPVVADKKCPPFAITLSAQRGCSRQTDHLLPKPLRHSRESGNLLFWSWDSRFRGNDTAAGEAH